MARSHENKAADNPMEEAGFSMPKDKIKDKLDTHRAPRSLMGNCAMQINGAKTPASHAWHAGRNSARVSE
jgi:hypothetical protein